MIRGAKVGRVGRVAAPPKLWVLKLGGGVEPPLILRIFFLKLSPYVIMYVEIIKSGLFLCVKFLKVGFFNRFA